MYTPASLEDNSVPRRSFVEHTDDFGAHGSAAIVGLIAADSMPSYIYLFALLPLGQSVFKGSYCLAFCKRATRGFAAHWREPPALTRCNHNGIP